MPQVAVVDIGKTTAKLVRIGTATGAASDALTQPNAVKPGPPYTHADVEGLWRFILDGLTRLRSAGSLDAIAITTHGATAALLAGPDLALPVLDYEDRGPEALAAEYEAARPPFSETMSPRLPAGLNIGAQLYWQARAFPEEFATVDAILPYPQFWAWKLCGVAASEVTSLGCHTDLWAPSANRFSSLVTKEGWTGRFPSPRPAASVLGPLRAEVAAATGLGPLPVVCGIHDSNASLLPWLRRLKAPFTVISSGTWTIVMTVGGSIDRLDPERDTLANVDAYGRPVPTARFMGGREYAVLLGDNPPPATPADVDSVIARGTLVAPCLIPGVGPFGSRRGGLLGDEALSATERTAAADLYLALVTRTCLELAGTGERIVVEGPLARNPIYCGLVAALAGVPVHPSPDATGTAMGAAMLADPELATTSGGLHPAITPFAPDGLECYARRWARLAGG